MGEWEWRGVFIMRGFSRSVLAPRGIFKRYFFPLFLLQARAPSMHAAGQIEGAPEAAWQALRLAAVVPVVRRPLQLISSFTVEGACAKRSMASLLKSHNVHFDAHVVEHTDQLRQLVAKNAINARESDAKDIYVLLACGAQHNMPALFRSAVEVAAAALRAQQQKASSTTLPSDSWQWTDVVEAIHILDACRPCHLENLRPEFLARSSPDGVAAVNPMVYVWDSAVISRQIDQFFALQQRQMRASRSHRRKRRRGSAASGARLSDESSDEDATPHSGGDDDDEESVNSDLAPVAWRTAGSVPPELEHQYYAVQCCGRSAAALILDVARMASQPMDGYVWTAAVALADMYVSRRITRSVYQLELRSLCLAGAVKPFGLPSHAAGAGGPASLADVTNGRSPATGGPKSALSGALTARLGTSVDVDLPCLRHTSLWNALWHSTAVATRLGLQDKPGNSGGGGARSRQRTAALSAAMGGASISSLDGEARLTQVLATTCGISKIEGKKLWSEISEEKRQFVVTQLQSVLQLDLRLAAVARGTSFAADVSNLDAARLMHALLAVPYWSSPGTAQPSAAARGDALPSSSGASSSASSSPFTAAAGEPSLNGTDGWWSSATSTSSLLSPRVYEHRRAHFWAACDLLDHASSTSLFKYANRAHWELCDAVYNATRSFIEVPGRIGMPHVMPYAVMPAAGDRGSQVFEHFWCPLRLRRLVEHASDVIEAAFPAAAVRPSLMGAPLLTETAASSLLAPLTSKDDGDAATEAPRRPLIVACMRPLYVGGADAAGEAGGAVAARGGSEAMWFTVMTSTSRPTESLNVLQFSPVQRACSVAMLECGFAVTPSSAAIPSSVQPQHVCVTELGQPSGVLTVNDRDVACYFVEQTYLHFRSSGRLGNNSAPPR